MTLYGYIIPLVYIYSIPKSLSLFIQIYFYTDVIQLMYMNEFVIYSRILYTLNIIHIIILMIALKLENDKNTIARYSIFTSYNVFSLYFNMSILIFSLNLFYILSSFSFIHIPVLIIFCPKIMLIAYTSWIRLYGE